MDETPDRKNRAVLEQVANIRLDGHRRLIAEISDVHGRQCIDVAVADSDPRTQQRATRVRLRVRLNEYQALEEAVKQLRHAVRRVEAQRKAAA